MSMFLRLHQQLNHHYLTNKLYASRIQVKAFDNGFIMAPEILNLLVSGTSFSKHLVEYMFIKEKRFRDFVFTISYAYIWKPIEHSHLYSNSVIVFNKKGYPSSTLQHTTQYCVPFEDWFIASVWSLKSHFRSESTLNKWYNERHII
jgi:hypothetical protein